MPQKRAIALPIHPMFSMKVSFLPVSALVVISTYFQCILVIVLVLCTQVNSPMGHYKMLFEKKQEVKTHNFRLPWPRYCLLHFIHWRNRIRLSNHNISHQFPPVCQVVNRKDWRFLAGPCHLLPLTKRLLFPHNVLCLNTQLPLLLHLPSCIQMTAVHVIWAHIHVFL